MNAMPDAQLCHIGLYAFDLEKMVDTSDAWIIERTGIKERHILRGEGLGTSYMAAEAVRGLLEKTGTKPEEVDLLICATTTPDMQFPSTANLICEMVGVRNVGSFDVQAACSGFLYSLTIAAQFIAGGIARKVVVVGAHLSGLPLNHELTGAGGHLLKACRTAPDYRLYALSGTKPPKPGLLRVDSSKGAAIEVEVWGVPMEAFGRLVAAVPIPLSIGTIRLSDGRDVKGFLVEAAATIGARDISS